MKKAKILLPAAMVIGLGFSWMVCIQGDVKEHVEYKVDLSGAQESLDKGLYEQAIEGYKEALAYDCSVEIYRQMEDAYELFYEEEPSAYVRNNYIDDMEQAAGMFPEEEEFWIKQMDLYKEALDYSSAYRVAKRAVNHKVKSEKIEKEYEELLYMVRLQYSLYSRFKMCLNGYISVCDGEQWMVLDEKGKELTESYPLVGLINDEGRGLYVNEIDTRLLDRKEITRARFKVDIEDAGYYSDSLECVPVKVKGKWKYLKLDGTFLKGEYEQAGSFYDGVAAVKEGGKWKLIDSAGKDVSNHKYEDIKLDLYGSYQQGDVMIAKENGKYHLYDGERGQISSFACDDMDICIDNGLIAFSKNGLWGYVNVNGEIVVEPQYQKAKSFSHGMAAVCGKDGKWGFINEEYKLVIGYEYLDAYYFTDAETCMVSAIENTYQIMEYMFD